MVLIGKKLIMVTTHYTHKKIILRIYKRYDKVYLLKQNSNNHDHKLKYNKFSYYNL